jgi:hypothetical protein
MARKGGRIKRSHLLRLLVVGVGFATAQDLAKDDMES